MNDRFICSAASVARDEPVTATASQVRGWLLVEVRGAWGVDAIHDSELGHHLPQGWKADLKRRGIRPICIRRGLEVEGDEHAASQLFFVVPARPGSGEPRCWTMRAPLLQAVGYLTDALDPRSPTAPDGWEPYDERLVLVCTNGRHDPCCATQGRPVVRHLNTTRWAEQLWECSHIGGDRFAANVVILPDSLYFGRGDGPQTEQLLDEHAAGRIALDWFRGRSTYRFPEQAAEHAVRREFDKRGVDDVRVTGRPSPDVIELAVAGVGRVTTHLRPETVDLDEALTCRGPLGQRETTLHVTSIDVS